MNSLVLSYDSLLDYTDWQRHTWRAWFSRYEAGALAAAVGAHADGRFATIGDLVRHIFSAEQKYIERMAGRPLTDTTGVSTTDIEALFDLGRRSRDALRTFVSSLDAAQLDAEREWDVAGNTRRLTPRKVLIHVVLHEIRHWAQIATLLRCDGLPVDQQDFLLAPVLPPRH